MPTPNWNFKHPLEEMEPMKVKVRCHNKKCDNSGDSIKTVYHPADTFYCYQCTERMYP